MDDFSAALLYQIKKEIAERYFGTRKFIEEEKAVLREHVRAHKETVGKAFYSDLGQIYQLLGSKELVDEFWEIVGVSPETAYDRYPLEIGMLNSCSLDVKVHGLTERSRYKKHLLNCYERLFADVKKYCESYENLMEECLVINEQVDRLRASYNLDEILRFVHSIENTDSLAGVLGGTIMPTHRADLEAKLAIPKLECFGKEVPETPALPGLTQVKERLKELAGRAYKKHRESTTTP